MTFQPDVNISQPIMQKDFGRNHVNISELHSAINYQSRLRYDR
ncbi:MULTISPECIES: hypothetical protein [Photorhabdus]|nr:MULTISPECIES: hypothetical protein [unclassified Photorhabdus]